MRTNEPSAHGVVVLREFAVGEIGEVVTAAHAHVAREIPGQFVEPALAPVVRLVLAEHPVFDAEDAITGLRVQKF